MIAQIHLFVDFKVWHAYINYMYIDFILNYMENQKRNVFSKCTRYEYIKYSLLKHFTSIDFEMYIIYILTWLQVPFIKAKKESSVLKGQ